MLAYRHMINYVCFQSNCTDICNIYSLEVVGRSSETQRTKCHFSTEYKILIDHDNRGNFVQK